MGDSCQLQSADCSLVDDTSTYYELPHVLDNQLKSQRRPRPVKTIGGHERKGIASIPSQQRVERKHNRPTTEIGHLTCRFISNGPGRLVKGHFRQCVRCKSQLLSGRGQVSGRSRRPGALRARELHQPHPTIHKISHQSIKIQSPPLLFRHNSINLPSLLSYSLLKRNGYFKLSKNELKKNKKPRNIETWSKKAHIYLS